MFETEKRPHITVVGDLILDRYLIGDATKLNPEQSGVVIRVDKEEDRLGGAAAVAMIAAGLGARVTLAGVVGRDEPGDRLRCLIDSHGIESHLWIDDRPTTWKQRIVTRAQLRPDRCDREVTTPVGEHAARFLSLVPIGDILLVSDYGKGVCTRSLLRSVGKRAHEENAPILVDPARSRTWSDYGRVTLIKANLTEATEQLGSEDRDSRQLVRQLSSEMRCHVIVTLGEGGMVCAERDEASWHVPATPVNAYDVCGAGDTIIATLGCELARRSGLRVACERATANASQQVRHLGCTMVTPNNLANDLETATHASTSRL